MEKNSAFVIICWGKKMVQKHPCWWYFINSDFYIFLQKIDFFWHFIPFAKEWKLYENMSVDRIIFLHILTNFNKLCGVVEKWVFIYAKQVLRKWKGLWLSQGTISSHEWPKSHEWLEIVPNAKANAIELS